LNKLKKIRKYYCVGGDKVKKILTLVLVLVLFSVPITALADSYTVKKGDSMWKIAVRYQIGVQEIINANPQVKNPNLIYPYQKLNIPNIDQVKTVEREVIRLTNIERQKHGLQPLKENWELSRVARHKTWEMREQGYLSHNSRSGTPFQMMKAYGIKYNSAGENIAKGQRSAQEVVQAWLNSEGHRKNMLSPNYTQIGVGYDQNGFWWCQMFIK
jgi:uncharacterized YkwD family protein/spore coat assembly protein SafA